MRRVGHCLVTVSVSPLSGEGLGRCVPSAGALCSLRESVLGAAGHGQPVASQLRRQHFMPLGPARQPSGWTKPAQCGGHNTVFV